MVLNIPVFSQVDSLGHIGKGNVFCCKNLFEVFEYEEFLFKDLDCSYEGEENLRDCFSIFILYPKLKTSERYISDFQNQNVKNIEVFDNQAKEVPQSLRFMKDSLINLDLYMSEVRVISDTFFNGYNELNYLSFCLNTKTVSNSIFNLKQLKGLTLSTERRSNKLNYKIPNDNSSGIKSLYITTKMTRKNIDNILNLEELSSIGFFIEGRIKRRLGEFSDIESVTIYSEKKLSIFKKKKILRLIPHASIVELTNR